MASTRERFEAKYEAVPESGCWIWTGAQVATSKYGVIRERGKTRRSKHKGMH